MAPRGLPTGRICGHHALSLWPNDFVCDGDPQPWSQTVLADNGLLAGGKATVTITYWDEWMGKIPLAEDVIQLSRAKQR